MNTDSAFPSTYSSEDGLSKREYYAGRAMQAILSNQTFLETVLKAAGGQRAVAATAIANEAITMADALLAELSK